MRNMSGVSEVILSSSIDPIKCLADKGWEATIPGEHWQPSQGGRT
jgi:hypothetical protein